MVSIEEKRQPLYRQLETLVTTNQLTFRAEATKAYAEYVPDMRRRHAKIASVDMGVHDFFTGWDDDIRPVQQKLSTAKDATTFQRALARNLVLSPGESQTMAEDLTDERSARLIEVYARKVGVRGQDAAAATLSQSEETIMMEWQRYATYEAYRTVAAERRITVTDPHASILRRLVQRRAQRRQTKKYLKSQRKELRALEARQTELETWRDGILAQFVRLQLDPVTVFAARQEYEKRLAKLTVANKKRPTKRLETFQAATQKIRDTHIEKVSDVEKLAKVQQAAKEIDSLLMQVFDMSDRERNELMTTAKEHRELLRTKQQILAVLSADVE